MGSSVNCFILGVLAFVLAAEAAKLPKDWKRCYLDKPESSECLRQGVEDAIHKLKNGAPELNAAPFDPLLITELLIGQGTGPVNVAQHFKNVRLHGLTGSKVLEQHIELDKNSLTARSITPMLRLEADYEMNGRVLLLPISGRGPCNVTLFNTKINHTLVSEQYEKKGKTYLRIKDYTVTLYPDKMTYKFDNLFNGDERLGNELNKVLNENWDAVFADVRSGYEQSFGLIFKDLANRIFSKVPIKDIFLFD